MTTETELYPLDMTCGTCHCDRRWHYVTHDGVRAGGTVYVPSPGTPG